MQVEIGKRLPHRHGGGGQSAHARPQALTDGQPIRRGAMALAVAAVSILLAGRQPPIRRPSDRTPDDDEILRGAYRVTLQRNHGPRRWG